MKKKILKLVLLCICMMSVLVGCGGKVKTESFLKDMAKGLEAKWEKAEEVTEEMTDLEQLNVFDESILMELEIIEKYDEKEFSDEDLEDLAKKYIHALKTASLATEYKENIFTYMTYMYEGIDTADIHLKEIANKYDLNKYISDKYKDNFERTVSKENVIDEEVVSESEEVNEQSGTIISAIAQDNNDLTGTYEDTEMGLTIIIVQKDGLVTYNFCNSDGSDPFIETDCTIESDYIAGQAYYISKNMDGSLAISSGVGGSWGHFVKCDDKAVIDLTDMNTEMEGESAESGLTYDLGTDVENGLLYCNVDGQITDFSGNIIQEYDYLFASPAGCLIDNTNNYILEDYLISESGQIYIQNSLLPIADEYNCATGVLTNSSGSFTYMEDDGSYYDEVILKSWYDENGMPKADGFPDKLNRIFSDHGYIITRIEDFRFIDGEWYTYESILRDPFAGDDMGPRVYAVLLEDISKWDDNTFVGTEYTSKKQIVVHGTFSGILNEDSVLVFGTLTSLTSNDEPELRGMYLEIVNGRF